MMIRFQKLACLLLLALPCVAFTAPAATPATVLSPNARVDGVSQGMWSQRWWEWAMSFEQHQSPIADRTGRLCGAGQDGPVWFLAGTYGSQLVRRTCTVPSGKHLFFPLINYVYFQNNERTLTCEDVTSFAARATDDPEILVAEIDGVKLTGLERHRQKSPDCFNPAVKSKTGANAFPSAANGYFLMLKPLSRGKHTLRFGGDLGSLQQAIEYELTVE